MKNAPFRFVNIRRSTCASILALGLIFAAAGMASAQSFIVLHSFTGQGDGAWPMAGLTVDQAGNVYGTSTLGGNVSCSYTEFAGCGTVFKLARHNSSWLFSTLYAFNGGGDGANPLTPVTFGPDGNLYGTTASGGYACNIDGCGTVFKLQPQPTFCRSVSCPWRKTELYQFTGQADGAGPATGSLTFDATGNIYGTSGGLTSQYPSAVVYELSKSTGGWNFSTVYSFSGDQAGYPFAGVVFDRQGNLWGSMNAGGLVQCGSLPQYNSCGVLFKLTPSGSGWTESAVVQFSDATGGNPFGNLLFDSAGNIYGTVSDNGPSGGGAVYKLNAAGLQSPDVLYGFPTPGEPMDSVAMDAAGNLYGTTLYGGMHNLGTVFKLTPSNGGWTYIDLHDFTGGSDGQYPQAKVTLDSAGNIYGIALQGGSQNCHGGCGTVWEITAQ